MFSRAQLIELLDYNQHTGVFKYKKRTGKWFSDPSRAAQWNSRFAGKECGTVQTKGNGYRRVKIGLMGKQYLAHRLAWVIMTGDMPPEQIDHIDRDATNNKWENLIDAKNLNQRNKSLQRNNKSGFSGVSWGKSVGKWVARVWCGDENSRTYKHLGVFDLKSDAVDAVKSFRSKNAYSSQHGDAPPYEVASIDD